MDRLRMDTEQKQMFPDALVCPVCISYTWEPWDCLGLRVSVYLLSEHKLVIRSLTPETGICPGEDMEVSKKILLAIKETHHETTHLAGPWNPGGANSVRPKSPKVPWVTAAWSWAT